MEVSIDTQGLGSSLIVLALRPLILLNCILYRQDDIGSAIPQRRLVLFIKHIVSQSQGYALAHPIYTEILRALAVLLPYAKDEYGDFWESIFGIMLKAFSLAQGSEDGDIPLINASLRLLSTFKSLATQGLNDDLQILWTDSATRLSGGLVGLMKKLQGKGTHLCAQVRMRRSQFMIQVNQMNRISRGQSQTTFFRGS